MASFIRKVFIPAFLIIAGTGSLFAQKGKTPVTGQNPYTQRTSSPQNPTPQNGNAVLGPVYQASECGLDYVTATQKLSMRVPLLNQPSVAQPATFAIAGIPGGATIQKAYVWCDVSGSGIPVTLTVTNPVSATSNYNMSLVGSDIDKCWGYAGTHTYRADITASVAGNGNYVLSGMPTNPPTSGEDTDGATLMIIWSDNTATFQGDVVIWDGAVVLAGGNTSQTITGFTNTCSAATSARAFMCIGDLQGLGTNLTMNSSAPFTVTEDWWNYIDQPTNVAAGQNTSNFTVSSSGDCYNFCMMGLYFRTTCTTCCQSPYTLAMTSNASSCSANNGTATATPNGGTGPFTYSWNTIPVQTTQTATNLGPGQYIVTVMDASGCSTIDTVNVAGQGSLGIAPASVNVTCNGGNNGNASVTPTGGTAPFTYVWSPNVSVTNTASNLAAGTYTVDVSDVFGCATSYTFTITEPPLVPLNVLTGNDTTICVGGNVTLTASGSGGSGAPYTYTWLNGVGSGQSVPVVPTTTTTYTVVISDQCNTPQDTDIIQVTVNQLPVVSFTGAPSLSGCAPVCVDFTDNSAPASTSSFWDFGDNFTSNQTNPTHCFYLPGSYDIKLTVTDINGCSNNITVPNYVTVHPFPSPGFTISSEQPITLEDPFVTFADATNGADTCYWDFGDGNLQTVIGCSNVAHNYPDTGTYHVMQIVVNQWGCRDTIYGDVVIFPFSTIYIPNTFTPNGNGTNDVFKPTGEYMSDFQMLIYDRWGNQIFKSNDMNWGWDGKVQGHPDLCQIDTYVYVITCTETITGRFHKFIGHVNLIR
ncbi:MAG: PKD domain-containing protein [Bacteroidetes bacterium]|nr:MAG: PKD domain-containing protein [Bacteroidota bacterium]